MESRVGIQRLGSVDCSQLTDQALCRLVSLESWGQLAERLLAVLLLDGVDRLAYQLELGVEVMS